MKTRWIAFFAVGVLMAATSLSDDLLGSKRGGGSGGGSNSGGKGGGGNSGGNGGGGRPNPPTPRPSNPPSNGNPRPSSPPNPNPRPNNPQPSNPRPNNPQPSNPRPSDGNGRGGTNPQPSRPDPRSSGGNTNQAPIRVESRQEGTRQGRSGSVNYRSQNNQARPNQPIRIDSAPRGNSSIYGQARREEGPVRNGNNHNGNWNGNNSYRNGYYQYNRTWCDDDFWYPYYQFSYDQRNCVVSPWYAYSTLPPYLNCSRVRQGGISIRFGNFIQIDFRSGVSYSRNNEYYGVNCAVDDLTKVFGRRDLRALDRITPRNDWVFIRGDYGDDYSIRSDDFYDMMRDLVSSTRTDKFLVQRVQYDGRYVQVYADHEYRDAWNRVSCVSMEFVFEEESRDHYVVTEFGTYQKGGYYDGR